MFTHGPHFQGLSTVGVGDLVRDQVKRGTAVGKELKVRNVDRAIPFVGFISALVSVSPQPPSHRFLSFCLPFTFTFQMPGAQEQQQLTGIIEHLPVIA